MAIKPNINPYTAAGEYNEKRAIKLEAMEVIVALDRTFTMIDVDERYHPEVRWCWDSSLLEIVGDRPLVYQITCLGHELVRKGRACRESFEQEIAA